MFSDYIIIIVKGKEIKMGATVHFGDCPHFQAQKPTGAETGAHFCRAFSYPAFALPSYSAAFQTAPA